MRNTEFLVVEACQMPHMGLNWIKQKVIVTSIEVAKTNFLFGMYDCTVDSDIGMGDFSLVLGILHMCGHAHVRSHVSPGMDCSSKSQTLPKLRL